MSVVLAGFSIRFELLGVSSFIRALGLSPLCYDRLLDFFHSDSLNLDKLTILWRQLVFSACSHALLRFNGRPVLVADGLKVPKAGRKMPAVKKLHQQSESNTKPEFIFGHSCQAIAILAAAGASVFAIPLASRIHEGLIFSNRDHRSLLDKMILLLRSLAIPERAYFVADAYYAAGSIIKGLLKMGHHLVTRVKSNAVAYFPPVPPTAGAKRRGRKPTYGAKFHLRQLLAANQPWLDACCLLYGADTKIQYHFVDLIWRPAATFVRFVAVRHPSKGCIILMSTDLALAPLDIIRLYAFRFKIEFSFKQSLRLIGSYAYHFWMATMTPRPRKSGNQYLHRRSGKYRDAVRRKLNAYHRHIQLGLIAQGLLQILAINFSALVWASFGSWLRTIRPGLLPSELVTALALRNSFPQFLADSSNSSPFEKFLRDNIDLSRIEGARLFAEGGTELRMRYS
jgi:hypothetical protein